MIPGSPPGPPGHDPAGRPPGTAARGKPRIWPWIALGCGGLLILAAVAAAAIGYWLTSRADQALKELQQMPALPSIPTVLPSLIPPLPEWLPQAPGDKTPAAETATAAGGSFGAASQAQRPGAQASAGTASGGGTSGAGGGGGPTTGASAGAPPQSSSPTCRQAVACCKTLLTKAPSAPSGLSGNCDALPTFSEEVCQRQLDAYRQAATLLGVTCP